MTCGQSVNTCEGIDLRLKVILGIIPTIMEGQTLLLFKLILLIGSSSAELCDRTTTMRVPEGNLGQSPDFNWLGVLHVHLPKWDERERDDRVAMSGIVLIKIKYALANADDVARIPQNIFKMNTKAMFLAALNTPWYVAPASYVTHPEYGHSTLNSIAVVKLNLDGVDDYPLTPICLPTADTFQPSRYLYLTGFTGDNEMLEKVIYKIHYLDQKVCEEFYNTEVVPSEQLILSAYLCGYAPNSLSQCIWENGMVLLSNSTGYYDLIGFGFHGPGCAAPARFIDLFSYFSWINFVTSPNEDDDDAGFKRKGDANKLIPNFPIHELYTKKGSRRHGTESGNRRNIEYDLYPFHPDTLKFHLLKPSMDDNHTLLIIPFNDTWERYQDACSDRLVLQYREYFELKSTSKQMQGTVTFKLSLYNKLYGTCACARVIVDAKASSEAVLSFKEQINLKENVEGLHETPKELFKYFPVDGKAGSRIETINTDTSDIYPIEVLNYDLYVKIDFIMRAIVKFELYAQYKKDGLMGLLPTTTPKNNETTTQSSTQTETTTQSQNNMDTIQLYNAKNLTKLRVKNKLGTSWGMSVRWPDKLVKEAVENLVADVDEVLKTESAARSEGPPGAAVMVCWLISASLRRAFFIY